MELIGIHPHHKSYNHYIPLDYDLLDGALTAIVPSESEYIDDMAFTIQLLEDGSMSIATSFLDEPMVFYLTAEAIQE